MVHPPPGSRSVHLLGHQRRRNGETSIRPSRGRIRNHDGLASRVSWGPIPRSPGPRLCQTLRFLGPFQRNVPRGLPWTQFSSSSLLDAAQNSDSHRADNAAAIYISPSPPRPTSQGRLDYSSFACDTQHRHNLPSGRRIPNVLNPKMTDLLFLAFAAVTIGAAILAIEARDLVYGAAALGIAFLGVAGLFFLLDAAYVGWFQIAVYIGAVVVLILFTVMLVGPKMGETPLGLKRVSLLAAILVSLLLGMTGALANATAFPGQDSCGSGCDLVLFSTSLLKNYGVQLEFMSLVMAAAVRLSIIILVSRLNAEIDLSKLSKLKG